jgi:NAD(P)-dependent dehydrogenase (short-subunit alcohol dehydrogenase family)
MAHTNPAPMLATYAASKTAIASIFQHLSEEVAPEKVQIINIHPGFFLTPTNTQLGLDEHSLPWDDGISH